MAGFVNNGTTSLIGSPNEPDGFVETPVTTFTDAEYFRDVQLDILKSTVEDNDNSVTLQNILDDLTSSVTSLVSPDFDASSLTVTCYTSLLQLAHNGHSTDPNDAWMNDSAELYQCLLRINIKTL